MSGKSIPQVKTLEKTISMQDIKESQSSRVFPRVTDKTKQLIRLGKKMGRFCRKCFLISAWEKWLIFKIESRRRELKRHNTLLLKAKRYHAERLLSRAMTSWCIETGLENGLIKAHHFSQVLLKRRALKAMFGKIEKGARKDQLASLRYQF